MRGAALGCAAMLAACTAQAPGGSAAAEPAPVPAAPSQPPPAPTASATLLDVFPAAPERELVLGNCASCHNAACAAIGQRPAARWDALLISHRDKVSGVDLDKVFAYLKTHFDDSTPEPKVPPALLQGGCTPF